MLTRIFVAAGLVLAAPALYAYQIVEGRYRVETAPGVFEDQLVVRCDDGRTLTVPWETKLAEACGEGLMGERVGKSAKAASVSPAEAAEPSAAADPTAALSANTAASARNPAALFDEKAQREAMLAQLRAQLGDVPERYIEFKPGPDGLSMRFLPPLNEIMRKYETCRRAREPGAQCGVVRDQAIARLSEPGAAAAAAAPAAPAAQKPGKTKASAKSDAGPKPSPTAAQEAQAPAQDAAAAAAEPAATHSDNEPYLVTEPQGAATTPSPVLPPAAAAKAETRPEPTDRAELERRAAADHAVCMKLKPKFECEQARARALGTLERPKAVKPAKPAKQAKAASSQIAKAPVQ